MKNYFFIFGLPRTRTSWLANLFTYSNSFCYHEALKFCNSINDFKVLLDEHDEQYVGNSDCSMINYFNEISTCFPNAKYVLIERKPSEVIESLLDFQLMDDYKITEKWIDKLQNQINHIKSQNNMLCLNYKDLNDMGTCKELWKYLLPEIAFNEKRWYFLDELYVNILIGKSYQRMLADSPLRDFQNGNELQTISNYNFGISILILKKLIMKIFIICFNIIFISVFAISQNIENIQTVIQGNKAVVTYDIIGDDYYFIEIYSSNDTFSNQIRFAMGDLGAGVKSGKDKEIIINLELEKITYNENLKFQINAISEKTKSTLKSDSSLNNIKFHVNDLRRKKTNEIYWPATNTSIFINLELYQNDRLIYPIASNIPNSGFFSWKTLKSLPIGSNYQIKIVEINNSLNLVRSNMFMIKPQIPTIVKVLAGVGAAVIIVGVLYYGLYY